jgi:uncharacterized protein YydD (DUF2326 family)
MEEEKPLSRFLETKYQSVMENKVETAEETIARLQRELGEAQGIIGEQAEQLEAKTLQGTGALPVITYKQQNYQVLAAKFHFNDVDYKAEDLAGNGDLVKKLLEAGSGLLQKIEKAK